jgi:heme-degrading monooxygenase HmoA
MYARVASFENSDTSRVDELIATVAERAEAGHELPDARRVLMLTDRENGRGLGITFFESEEAIREAEPVFERMGDQIPEELRGKRTSVAIYEAAIEDVADGANAARVSSLEGSTDSIDEGIAFIQQHIVPAASDITGWRGIIGLVDRTNGRTLTITFWDSKESLAASETWADQARGEAAAAMDETVTSVERYEVALSKVLASTRA